MRLKNVIDEDFVQFKEPCMFISTCFCDWKCCKELGMDICMCQNSPAYDCKIVNKHNDALVNRYLKNPITHAIVFGGFEPILQFEELIELIRCFRDQTSDPIVIFTGYYEHEIKDKIDVLKKFSNIIVKFGRYIPGQEPHKDNVLGVNLANKEQYAVKIS